MTPRQILIAAFLTVLPFTSHAQSVGITATYTVPDRDNDNEMKTVETDTDITEEAPLDVNFKAVPKEMGEHTPAYEWHIRKDGEETDILVRYEEETQYRFTESGTFRVTLRTRLTDIGADLDSVAIKVTISESRLEMPNAFSPNGDGKNDIYGAKGVCDPNSTAHYKSIVEFHAYIFNRWGQKLFEWTDVSKGWDGTYKGNPVKDGIYYVLVKAKGAEGREYNIKKDVNLLRGYTESTSTSENP